MQVTVVTEPEFLAAKELFRYDVVLLNYCNWQRPGLSEAAQANFVKYLAEGGGLAIVHFTNGAFHASLPGTPPSDWPEFRKICRRVWDHAPGKSSHDPYGRFRVTVTKDHPITEGLGSYETIDELYCNQQGDLPIEVLATAHSTVTDRDEPMAFVYRYGDGLVFQTVLGHASESIRVPGTAARSAAASCGPPDIRSARCRHADRSQIRSQARAEGRWRAARSRAGLRSPRHDAYDQRPLSVECWTKLNRRLQHPRGQPTQGVGPALGAVYLRQRGRLEPLPAGL
jgi:hypothetical protein